MDDVAKMAEAVLEQGSWVEQAACTDQPSAMFFPSKWQPGTEAKEVCAGCEVRLDCLDYAVRNNEKYGIWGGLTERERRRVKRKRAST